MRRRTNRHAELRRHKRKMKQRYGHGLYTTYRTNLKLHEQECRDEYGDMPNARNGGYDYWKIYYLTGPRQYAKDCTNRVIRAMYRDLFRKMNKEDMDEIQAYHGADYEKAYDYAWTIW